MARTRIDSRVGKGKSKGFYFVSSSDDMVLVDEYSRALGISKGRLIREAVREFLVRNKDTYDGLVSGHLVSVKDRRIGDDNNRRVIIMEKKRYDELHSDIEG